MIVYIGSKSFGKKLEYASIFTEIDTDIEIKNIPDYVDEPEELENNIEENAAIKAIYYSSIVDEYVLTDDSGIMIRALNNYPGVISGRFFQYKFDENMNIVGTEDDKRSYMKSEVDTFNNKKVLDMMKDKSDRVAKLGGVVCLAKNGKIEFQTSNFVNGYISEKMIGTNGFGYDSIFIGDDTGGKTFAELDHGKKAFINFRSTNVKRFLEFVKSNIISKKN